MAYMLLAVGALMSVAGAYLGLTGYHIVQIEEGWSSVIAGATLFTGGILTAALGLVLRTLLRLQTAMVPPPLLFAEAEIITPSAAPASGETKIEPKVEDRLRPERQTRTAALPPAPSLDGPKEPPSAPLTPAPAEPLLATPVIPPEAPAQEPSVAHAVPVASVPEPEPTQPEAPHIEPDHTEPPAPQDDYRLETPSTPEHDLVEPHVAAPPAPPSPEPVVSEDWLDRAFAEFDEDLPKTKSVKTGIVPDLTPVDPKKIEPKAKAIEPQPVEERPVAPTPHPEPEPVLEPAYADLQPAEAYTDEPAYAPEAPAPTAPPSGPAVAVIGRYESEGTSYVMYADGSIEAHSSAGIYRFASMAELKTFIES